jgi:hypothetical protein
MATTVKFSSKIEERTLNELRTYADESKRNISDVLNEAVAEYLSRARLRPAFIAAAASVIDEHVELLTKLAQ